MAKKADHEYPYAGSDLASFGRFGIAALLPGMLRMQEVLNQEIERMQALIRQAEETAAPAAKRGRPPKEKAAHVPAISGGVVSRDEAIRALEMSQSVFSKRVKELKIRPAGREKGKSRQGLYRPSDIERIRRVNAKHAATPGGGYWAKMTPEERQAEMTRRMAMRQKKAA